MNHQLWCVVSPSSTRLTWLKVVLWLSSTAGQVSHFMEAMHLNFLKPQPLSSPETLHKNEAAT